MKKGKTMKYSIALPLCLFMAISSITQGQETKQKKNMTTPSQKVTAGRDYLGDIAPTFAEINDDVLFGKVWSREKELCPRDRSMITLAALMGSGNLDQSFKAHLQKARENGVTKAEIVEIITHVAFYTGWPKGWSAFSMAKEVFTDDAQADEKDGKFVPLFELGDVVSPEYAKYFTGKCYVNALVEPGEQNKDIVANVTFEPGCRNFWHKHQSMQILLVTEGKGWYQESGKPAQPLLPGDVVKVQPGVKHWHGAVKDSWFAHIAIENTTNGPPAWLEPLPNTEYDKLHE